MDDLSIYPATPEQVKERKKRTWIEWSRGSSLEAYIAREEMLDSQPYAVDGKMMSWVLAPRKDPTTLEFYTSCVTYRREAIASTMGSCIAYGVVGVFTPECYRRKGYAKHLMRLLHFVLIKHELLPPFPRDVWGEPPAIPLGSSLGDGIASVLHSAIGPNFYRLCGPGLPGTHREKAWITLDAIPAMAWQIDLLPSSSPVSMSPLSSSTAIPNSGPNPDSTSDLLSPSFEWISRDELGTIWDLEASLIKEEVLKSNMESNYTIFSLLPSAEIATFPYARSKNFIPTEWFFKSNKWGAKIINADASTGTNMATEGGSCIDGKNYGAGDTKFSWSYATWSIHPEDAEDTDSTRGDSPRAEISESHKHASAIKPLTLVITLLRANKTTFPVLLDCAKTVAKELSLDRVEVWYLPKELEELGIRLGGKSKLRDDHLPALAWFGEKEQQKVVWRDEERWCWC